MDATPATLPTIVLTRPAGRNESLSLCLHASGCVPLVLPALEILPTDFTSLPDCAPARYDLIVFVSTIAARFYFQYLAARGKEGEWNHHTRVATVGSASAATLPVLGLPPAISIVHPSPEQPQDSEALWACLEQAQIKPQRVLIACGEGGRLWLTERLQQAGAHVDRLALYVRRPAQWMGADVAALRRAMQSATPPIILLTSTQSIKAVYANIRRLDLTAEWPRCRFLVIHPRIQAELRATFNASGKVEYPVVKLCSPSDASILEAIRGMVPSDQIPGLQSRHDR